MSTELVTAVVLGLVVNEFCDISPWLARQVIRFAARCVPNLEARERLEEEWTAGLQDRPGKILKLISALTVLASAMTTVRGIYRSGPRCPRLRRFLTRFFDREGRIVMGVSLVSSVIDTRFRLWGDVGWGYAANFAILLVAIHGIDLWRLRRAMRRAGRLQNAQPARPTVGDVR